VPGELTVKYGGNTPCVTIEHENQLIIIDCGSGIRVLGQHLMANSSGNPINAHILISHAHWDHIQGFPFFTPAFIPSNSFDIYGAEGLDQQIEGTLAGQMQRPYFPVGLDAMAATLRFHSLGQGTFEIGGLRVDTCNLNHPGNALGFRVSDNRTTVTYLSDHEPFHRMMTTPTTNTLEIAWPDDVETVTDVARSRDLVFEEFCRDSDLLIEDSPYTSEEYHTRVGWGHACVDDVVDVAVRANVRQLALFHHEPNRDDGQMDDLVSHCRARVPTDAITNVIAAQEGLRIDFTSAN
jgi:phosphoribosyl 1,2-cyclic phosphodiesterase